ncbi:MAG: GNAT family N-acetyltransferase [Myxococcales bacterium]
MNDHLTFERINQENLETFLALVEQYYAFDGIAFEREVVRRAALELMHTPAFGAAWLIADGGRFVGHFVVALGFDFEFGGRQATVTELFLEPAARKRGIGRAALAFVEATLLKLGIHTLELQVERDNHEAQAFYARLGLKAHDRIPMSKRLASVSRA